MHMAMTELGMTTAQIFGTWYVISMFILALMFNSLILLFLTKRFGFKKTGYEYALLVTFITAFISLLFEFFVPIWVEIWLFPVYFAMDVVLIYLIYPESLAKSVKTGFVWWLLAAVVSSVLGLVIGLVLTAIGIATGAQSLLAMWLTG